MKRAFDLIVSGLALVLLAPAMLLIAIAVHLVMGGPILFRQLRPGFREKPFTILKYRTMIQTSLEHSLPESDHLRLTPLGDFLRRTSLDELPELWNVFRGDMSLVGPRPLLMQYLPLYNSEQKRRHDVKPGITGWAQIHGRNKLSWDEKFKLDVWYVDHQSLWLDLKIIFQTLAVTFKREGISAEGHVTMPAFTGNPIDEHTEPKNTSAGTEPDSFGKSQV